MQIHQSAEDYLESILRLQENLGQVRSIDIVKDMGYSKPSISIAMKRLRENGYIQMDGAGTITLTEQGLAIAQKVYDRHHVLTDLLVSIGVSPETAAEDACKIEHDLSEESYEKLRAHLRSLQKEN